MRRHRFTFLEWHYTNSGENLFELSEEAYWWFKAFVQEARA